MACRAGSNCRRRFGSWSNGGIGDCGTGETGTVGADEAGAEAGFSPEAEDVEGVVQEWGTDLSTDVDSEWNTKTNFQFPQYSLTTSHYCNIHIQFRRSKSSL